MYKCKTKPSILTVLLATIKPEQIFKLNINKTTKPTKSN